MANDQLSVEPSLPIVQFSNGDPPVSAEESSERLSLDIHLRVPMMTRRDLAILLYCLACTDTLPGHLEHRKDELIAALNDDDLCPSGVFTRVMQGGQS